MTAYTGSTIRSTKFGRNQQLEVLGSVSWSDAALSTADTLTIPNILPEGVKLGDIYVEVFGSVIDTNATQAAAIKVGTETDDDAFVPAIVVKGATQTNVIGTGDAIVTAGASITDDRDIVITPTTNPTTGATSGTLYVRLIARLLMK